MSGQKEAKCESSWGLSLLSAILIMGPALYFGYSSKPTEMGLSIVAGAITLAFINLDKIELIKGAGFEARTIKKVAQDMKETMELLRLVAKPLAISSLNSVVWNGRWGGMTTEQKEKTFQAFNDMASLLGFAEDKDYKEVLEQDSLLKTWDKFNKFREKAMEDTGRGTLNAQNLWDKLKELCESNLKKLPDEAEVLSIIEPFKEKMTPESMELLEDYVYFKTYRKLRRPDVADDK